MGQRLVSTETSSSSNNNFSPIDSNVEPTISPKENSNYNFSQNKPGGGQPSSSNVHVQSSPIDPNVDLTIQQVKNSKGQFSKSKQNRLNHQYNGTLNFTPNVNNFDSSSLTSYTQIRQYQPIDSNQPNENASIPKSRLNHYSQPAELSPSILYGNCVNTFESQTMSQSSAKNNTDKPIPHLSQIIRYETPHIAMSNLSSQTTLMEQNRLQRTRHSNNTSTIGKSSTQNRSNIWPNSWESIMSNDVRSVQTNRMNAGENLDAEFSRGKYLLQLARNKNM